MQDLEKNKILTEKLRQSPSRRRWRFLVYLLTWWIPSPLISLCGMKRQDVRDAWREKVAICILIGMACGSVLFFIIFLPRIICPKVQILNRFEVEEFKKPEKAYVTVYGRYYDITEIVATHVGKIGIEDIRIEKILGLDVSQMFYPTHNWNSVCPGVTNPGATWDNIIERDPQRYWPHYASNAGTGKETNYLGFISRYAKGRIGWKRDYVKTNTDPTKKLIMIFDNVYDVAAYFQGQSSPGFFDDNMYKIFTNMAGKDATSLMQTLMKDDPIYYRNVLNCMNNIFYVGTVDNRDSFKCQFSNYVLLTSSIIIVAVIGFKFFAALRQMHASNPEDIDKYVIVQIPCFTEGRESLENTISSVANTKYDDKYKLAFIICDGLVTGEGNDRPTPEIVLDILYGGDKIPPSPESYPYLAIGEGKRAHNTGKVYSGLYEHKGHRLPFIVVVKTGNETEQNSQQPGNRGKRDSQIMLMKFLSKVYSKKSEMTELEYEIYTHMNDITSPDKFEYMLMVDADTTISEDSLTKMTSCMISNKKLIGLCGETFVANPKESATTYIQVYEYFISHHLSKAFESMFGSVTCLPGCFCMYRIRTKTEPLLISSNLIKEYSDPNVNTLHKKNLLSLGEDRYLTTLVLKHFATYKTMFTPDAQCETNVPSNFNILLSQRRRWINSTIHNLVELSSLGSQLCGFCCVSMRFVVILDLLSTIVAPASVVYVFYLAYIIAFEDTVVPLISLVMIAAIYGLQAIVFILKSEWSHVGWMILYILAMPLFSFWMPLYSFWNMDDFNWGNTRIVDGEDGKQKQISEDLFEDFDRKSIPTKSTELWRYEKMESEATVSNQYNYNHYTYDIHPKMIVGGYATAYTEYSTNTNGGGFVAPSMYGNSQAPTNYQNYQTSYAASDISGSSAGAYYKKKQRGRTRKNERNNNEEHYPNERNNDEEHEEQDPNERNNEEEHDPSDEIYTF